MVVTTTSEIDHLVAGLFYNLERQFSILYLW